MPLTVGAQLGPYEILAPLGAGGMGEVYRARDIRLGRDVAVKVLPSQLTHDPGRRARLEREARLLASLTHPNVAAVYGLEEAAGTQAIVMELVEGRTLADRVAAGPLAVPEALSVAIQVAEALEAAHEKGIAHRDLKPANVKVTAQGQVKVLDFGLAKDVGSQASGEGQTSATTAALSEQLSRPGAVLGTASYMSPEQARGLAVDQRTDVWAFGCLLFELLSGRCAFRGGTDTDTLALVLQGEPDWAALPPATPDAVRRVVDRCLRKDPRRRLHAIADARIELEAVAETDLEGRQQVPAAATRTWTKVAAGALLGAGAMAAMLLLVRPFGGPTGQPTLRVLTILEGVGVDPSNVQWGLNVSEPRISPDGSRVAYVKQGRLWIRDLDRLEPRPVEDSDGARDAFWSPDSRVLGYVAGTELRRVDAAGGPSILLARLDGAYVGGAWGAADRIVVALGGRGLFELSARGGEPKLLLAADGASGDFDFHSPIFIEPGPAIAYVLHEQVGYRRHVEVFDGRDRRVVYRAPASSLLTSLAFDASARQIIMAMIRSNAGLWAAPLGTEGEVTHEKAQLLVPHGLAPSVARDGTLVYVDGMRIEPLRLVRVDRAGVTVAAVGEGLWDMDRPVASPEGDRVAVISTHNGSRDVWVYDLERGTADRVTADPPDNMAVAWADAGRSIVYATSFGGPPRLVKQRADRDGRPTVLIEDRVGRASLPRDGRIVVYEVGGTRLRRGPGDLWWFPSGQPDQAAALVATPADEVQPAVSPDGRLLAYASDESGRYEVYLRALSGEGRRLRVSSQGGEAPIWSRDGRELYYVADSTLMAVRVASGGDRVGSPERLFSTSDAWGPLVANGTPSFTLGPGQDFILIERRTRGTPVVVAAQNWTALLSPRAPPGE